MLLAPEGVPFPSIFAMKIYVRHQPRSIALANEDYALVFRCADKSNANSDTDLRKCLLEFTPRSALDFTKYRLLSDIEHKGCLGLIEVNSDVFVCLISGSEVVASPRHGETINLIHGVEFYCVNRSDWDYAILDENGLVREQNLSLAGTASDYVPRFHIGAEHSCASIRKLLTTPRTFYYSSNFDLATVLQYR